jgi:hypothetical protein
MTGSGCACRSSLRRRCCDTLENRNDAQRAPSACSGFPLHRCWTAPGHTFGHSGVDAVGCRRCSTATVAGDQLSDLPPARCARIRFQNLPIIV